MTSSHPTRHAYTLLVNSLHPAGLGLAPSPECSKVVALDCDIILGRGTLHSRHPGNRHFYEVIDSFLPYYDGAKTKAKKTDIILQIYKKVSASGQRFLREDPPFTGCIEVDAEAAKKKIGHAIRYRQQRARTMCRASPASDILQVAHNAARNVVTPLVSPVLPLPCKKMARDIFSDEDLDSVLGFPGQMDIPVQFEETLPPVPIELNGDCHLGPPFQLMPVPRDVRPEELLFDKKMFDETAS